MGRIVRILALALGLFGAVMGAQTPEFAQQYRQRLGGRIDELKRVVARFDNDAKKFKKTPEEALQALLITQDPIIKARGEAMRDDKERLIHLSKQINDMQEAGSFWRIAYMMKGIDPVTAGATLDTYEFALPVTSEGFIATGVGFILFYWFAWFVNRILKRLFGLFFRKKQSQESGSDKPRTVSRSVGSSDKENDSQVKIRFSTPKNR